MIPRPLLPTYDKIIPYLKRIDANRVYTNFGELNNEYENRLSVLFKSPIVSCSSATSGLTCAILALNLPPKSFIACPSWTFVATPAAIVAAGHIPYFFDVDRLTGEMNNIVLLNVSAIIVVSPCGAPIDMKKWEKIRVPVIIDGAGGFDVFSTKCNVGEWPVVISTHATKSFGTGEGGFIACKDKNLLEKIRRISNFGLNSLRQADTAGMNAKLSEYHAAVGLAELDGWEEKRLKFLKKTKIYGLDYATSLVAVKTGEGRKGVYGCHKLDAYKDYPRQDLFVTEDLMRKVSFIPVAVEV